MLVTFLLENGTSFVFTEKFNQDRLEEYFGKRRSLGWGNDNPDVYQIGYNSNTIRMQRSIAINTGNTSGSCGNKKKRASWSSVDNGALMKRKRGNDLWFWFYEFLIKTIYAETNLYKIGKGAAWNYSIKLTPPQVFVFNSERALWTASDSGGKNSRFFKIFQWMGLRSAWK